MGHTGPYGVIRASRCKGWTMVHPCLQGVSPCLQGVTPCLQAVTPSRTMVLAGRVWRLYDTIQYNININIIKYYINIILI